MNVLSSNIKAHKNYKQNYFPIIIQLLHDPFVLLIMITKLIRNISYKDLQLKNSLLVFDHLSQNNYMDLFIRHYSSF